MFDYRRPNLADKPTRGGIELFLQNVVALATFDFERGGKQYGRTGAEIIGLTAGTHRKFHISMASYVYNKTLWTYESGDKE